MRKLPLILVALILITPGCIGGGGGNERVVLVDYSHDEFASLMVQYFPKEVAVTPGMTVVFKQTWTGEPHTVTGGTLVNEMMGKAAPWTAFFSAFEGLMASGAKLPDPERPEGSAADFFRAVDAARNAQLKRQFYSAYDNLREQGIRLPDRKNPGDATFESTVQTVDEESNKFFEDLGLPWAFGEDDVAQNAGQPCFLTKGAPPKRENQACSKSRQRQPVFDGTQSYYNSGIIPYEGPQGNTFRVKLADDIKPGNYSFYCAVHGPEQSTVVRVRPAGSSIPSQTDVSREARKEIADFAKPMIEAFRDARDGEVTVQGEKVKGPFAGLVVPVFGAVDEFLPRRIHTRVGQPVTWKIMGWDHSISFDVPSYFPIIRFAKDGKVSINPQMEKPAGGSPAIPEDEGIGPDTHMGVLKIDGGTYDGSGFFSSSVFSAEPWAEYTLRFSEPGTYKYACLFHPPMVGTVVVTE